MRLQLIAVGRLKSGPERDLVERYVKRIVPTGRALGFAGFTHHELDESRARRVEERKLEEAKAIAALLPVGGNVMMCDETGHSMTSPTFASVLGRFRDDGASSLSFVIGGPDGLDPDLRQKAGHVIAFGAMTLPHQIARILMAEQVYRAMTILSGHPYHRA